jgi:hypothetical protein
MMKMIPKNPLLDHTSYQASLRSIVDVSGFLSNIVDCGMSTFSVSFSDSECYPQSSYSPSSCHDSEYGYFDETYSCDDLEYSISQNYDHFLSEQDNIFVNDNKSAVICALENGIAPIICRSFENLNNISRTFARISLPGFRIVQDEDGEAAEFKFVLSIDNKNIIAWKRFSHFRDLAQAVIEYSKMSAKTLRSTAPGGGLSFHNTLQAWQEVLNNRPWFFQCLNIAYLIEKSLLLENFMKNLFFEVADITMMLEFASEE